MLQETVKFSERLIRLPLLDGISGSLEARATAMGNIVEENPKKYGFSSALRKNSLFEYYLLKLSFNRNTVVYQLDKAVREKVLNTEIRLIPEKLPALMNGTFLVEARENEMLLDDIKAVGYYAYEDLLCFLVIRAVKKRDGSISEFKISGTFEREEFIGKSIKKYIRSLVSNKEQDGGKAPNSYTTHKIDEYNESLMVKAIHYVIVFGLMLTAERTPFEYSNKLQEKKYIEDNKKVKKTWIARYVNLSKRYIKQKEEETKRISKELGKEGKSLEEVHVKSFIRRQPYGKDRKLVKEIWIEEFKRKQWVNDGNIKYIVRGNE